MKKSMVARDEADQAAREALRLRDAVEKAEQLALQKREQAKKFEEEESERAAIAERRKLEEAKKKAAKTEEQWRVTTAQAAKELNSVTGPAIVKYAKSLNPLPYPGVEPRPPREGGGKWGVPGLLSTVFIATAQSGAFSGEQLVNEVRSERFQKFLNELAETFPEGGSAAPAGHPGGGTAATPSHPAGGAATGAAAGGTGLTHLNFPPEPPPELEVEVGVMESPPKHTSNGILALSGFPSLFPEIEVPFFPNNPYPPLNLVLLGTEP
eukprot:gene3228-4197_t